MTKKKPAKKPQVPQEIKAACKDIVDELYREIDGRCLRQMKELSDKIDSVANRVEAVEKSFWRKWW